MRCHRALVRLLSLDPCELGGDDLAILADAFGEKLQVVFEFRYRSDDPIVDHREELPLEVRIEAGVARVTQGQEIVHLSGSTLTPRADVVDVEHDVRVVGGALAACHAAELVSLQDLHTDVP